MKIIVLKAEPLPADQILQRLEKHGIRINYYAEEYFKHPRFSIEQSGEITVTISSLQELGFENGATLAELFQRVPELGMKPCTPGTGVLLRMAWTDQPQSANSILSGTHRSPDQAVTVLSEILEDSDDFPKGLYLRNVDGNLWLRGYICDAAYRFPGDALFAFETKTRGDFANTLMKG